MKQTPAFLTALFTLTACRGEPTYPEYDTTGTGSEATTDPESDEGGDASTTDASTTDTTTSNDTTDTTTDTGNDTTDDDGGLTECSDEMYANYTACLTLADTSESQAWQEACLDACPAAVDDACGYSSCASQCYLDTPLADDVLACRAQYPLCVYAVISLAETECNDFCYQQKADCEQSTTCTDLTGNVGVMKCSAQWGDCLDSCADTQTPTTGWAFQNDGECGTQEASAAAFCPIYLPVCECDTGAPDCGYWSCNASCQAANAGHKADCAEEWADCPSTETAEVYVCQEACYATQAACTTSCTNYSACSSAGTACIAACG